MEFFDVLKYRKSVRKFSDEKLSQDEITVLLTAGNSAPVGSNMYKDIHLTIVQDRAVLDKLSEAAALRWQDKAKMKEIIGEMPGGGSAQPLYDPFYGAPAVIFVSHRKQNVQPGIEYANASCVALAMHLAATDLGLGSVLMWFALESMREIPALDHAGELRLPENYEPLIGLAAGHLVKPADPRELSADKITVNYL